MRHLLFLLLLSGLVRAQDSVAKVVEIKAAQQGGTSRLEYLRPPARGKAVRYPAFLDMDGKVRDQFFTDSNTLAALEFAIGGRIGLNRDSSLTIVTERSATANATVQKIKLTKGAMWAKCQKLKDPLEIETGGGVMGIKGTEFVVETVGSDTKVSLLEGEIAVSEPNGTPLGTMKPGDQWILALKKVPVKKTYEDPEKLRTELQDSPEWKTAMSVVSMISGFEGGGQLGYYANTFAGLDFENHPAEAALKIAQEFAKYQGTDLGPLTPLANAFSNRPPEKPDFPTGLYPDNSKEGTTPLKGLRFSWHKMENVAAYVLLLSRTEDFKELEWTTRTPDLGVVYPPNAAPLPPGRHYWRLIPVDAENKPAEGYKGSQALVELK